MKLIVISVNTRFFAGRLNLGASYRAHWFNHASTRSRPMAYGGHNIEELIYGV